MAEYSAYIGFAWLGIYRNFLGLFMKTANTVYTKEYKLVADKPPYKKRKYNAGYISTEKMEKEVEVKAVDCIGSLVPSANVRLPWTFDQAARLTLVNGIFSGSTIFTIRKGILSIPHNIKSIFSIKILVTSKKFINNISISSIAS